MKKFAFIASLLLSFSNVFAGNEFEAPAMETVQEIILTEVYNKMFDGIPDGAYVTLFLVRANILQVQEEGEDLHIGEYDWNAIIENCPEIACQSTSIALGTAAKLSFVLVRNL